jgi:hypothetical protein
MSVRRPLQRPQRAITDRRLAPGAQVARPRRNYRSARSARSATSRPIDQCVAANARCGASRARGAFALGGDGFIEISFRDRRTGIRTE